MEIDDSLMQEDDLLAQIDSVEGEFKASAETATAAAVTKESCSDDRSTDAQQMRTEKDMEEDALLASDDDEILNADIGDVDLFESDESEPENEGRFKSGAKTEKKSNALIPFSKLTGSHKQESRNKSYATFHQTGFKEHESSKRTGMFSICILLNITLSGKIVLSD